MQSINPATGEKIQDYTEISTQDAFSLIENAHTAFQSWRTESFETRARLMNNAAGVLRDKKETFAQLMTAEMGKPVKEARAEIDKCAWVCEYYAENAQKFLSDEQIKTDADESFITYQPIGVVLAVMPWNFPFWQVFRFAAPALMSGNTAVLKHASNVLGCALAIEQIFKDAGFPEGCFRTLLVSSKNMEAIIAHDKIRAVTLTGSEAAGRAVATTAGKHLKKTVLELGGSDPYIILEDADIEHAAKTCAKARLLNSGQSCIAAKRFIAVDAVHDEFLRLLHKEMEAAKMGNPADENTDVGPQASMKLRDDLHDQVQRSIKKGAACILGGEIPSETGAFYPPTILADVGPGMPAFDEELFGPVAAVIRARDEDDAIALANNSDFGLGGAVFTQNIERGKTIARERIDTGACFVNSNTASDPRLPFGGVKNSGYGRELSHFGIREFVNIKTVSISK